MSKLFIGRQLTWWKTVQHFYYIFRSLCLFSSWYAFLFNTNQVGVTFQLQKIIPLNFVISKVLWLAMLYRSFLLRTLPLIPHGQWFPFEKKIWVIRSCLIIVGLLYDTNLSKNMNTCFLTLWTNICNKRKTKVWFLFQTRNKICDRNINLPFEVQDLCHLQLY